MHLSIDVQNIFARGGIWETPWMERVLPRIVEIAARHPARTVFTRFITPMHADDRPGGWRPYFRKWHRVTRAELPASELELVPALRRFVPPAEIVDEPAYQEGHPQHSSPSWGMKLRALRRSQREQEPRSPFVFTGERGGPFTTAGFPRMVERAGIQQTNRGSFSKYAPPALPFKPVILPQSN